MAATLGVMDEGTRRGDRQVTVIIIIIYDPSIAGLGQASGLENKRGDLFIFNLIFFFKYSANCRNL